MELQVLRQWAFLRNHIDLQMSREGGPPVRRSGYMLTILRKAKDGRWLLVRDANLLSPRS